MATNDTFATFGRRLDVFLNGLSGEDMKRVMTKVGRAAQRDASEAAAADLGGDAAFSGWKRVSLATEIKTKGNTRVWVIPTRRSAGAWTVAEQGRNRGDAAGFAGPGLNHRTGVTSRTRAGNLRKVRAVRSRRWNGYTDPKYTATDAVKLINDRTPDRVEAEIAKAIRAAFD